MMTIKPPALHPGDKIGICTPSYPGHVFTKEKFEHGLGNLRKLGFQVHCGTLTAQGTNQGYRSGSPQERACEFMELVEAPEIKGIITTIGGYNSSSLIPSLDFRSIRDNPKVICGYSDVTALQMAILAKAELRTFYGPAVVASFGEYPDILPYTKDNFLAAVTNAHNPVRMITPPVRWSNHFIDANQKDWRQVKKQFWVNEGWTVAQEGTVAGPLIIANLDTFLALAGTENLPRFDGCILVLDEAHIRLSKFERSLTQLRLMGVFQQIRGLIISKPYTYDPEGAPFELKDLVLECVPWHNKPIVLNFDCGHTYPMVTLAQMTRAALRVTGQDVSFRLEETMVM